MSGKQVPRGKGQRSSSPGQRGGRGRGNPKNEGNSSRVSEEKIVRYSSIRSQPGEEPSPQATEDPARQRRYSAQREHQASDSKMRSQPKSSNPPPPKANAPAARPNNNQGLKVPCDLIVTVILYRAHQRGFLLACSQLCQRRAIHAHGDHVPAPALPALLRASVCLSGKVSHFLFFSFDQKQFSVPVPVSPLHGPSDASLEPAGHSILPSPTAFWLGCRGI